jgi:hypothetical protein
MIMANVEPKEIFSIIEKAIKSKYGSNNLKGCNFWIFPSHFHDFVIQYNASKEIHGYGYKAEIIESGM